MTSERHAASPALSDSDLGPAMLRTPPTHSELPGFDLGWQLEGEPMAAFLSYVGPDPSVNWSDELEHLHEESSRAHFLDRWTRSAIIERVGPMPPAARIVDVGCSTGFLLEDLRARYPGATLVGVDLIGGGLAKAHRLVPSARLLRADACDLPIADAAADAIVSANLLEHVPDDTVALREFARVLRPGGRAVIVVPAGPSTYDYYDRFLGHERRYARRELAAKCTDAGLRTIEDGFIGALLYPAFWAVKQSNRRRHSALDGEALERRVAADIARTQHSTAGEAAWAIERRLSRRGLQLPFGIRSLVVACRPGPTL
ncbi:MAG: class I SAM-dependent methyltransferase [Solirubrobacteraceae bacterium]